MLVTKNGYNLYVGGNDWVNPVQAQLLTKDINEDAVI